MADDFITLSNRLLTRCPAIGIVQAEQYINDSWQTLQAMKEWSWRRRSNTFAPPDLYNFGSVTTNVASGNPTLITGLNTNWTPDMIGRQIRMGGLMYPYYTIVSWLSPTAILIDQPFAGPDVTNFPYQIIQVYFNVPEDFGYFYAVVSIKDSFQLWTNVTQGDLAWMDPQRAMFGQTYAVAFRDYNTVYGGVIGPVIAVSDPTHPGPISTTTNGFNYVANATYIIQITATGQTGTATFRWMRAGQVAFGPSIPTSDTAQDLMDGVQIYWPDGQQYFSGDLFVINAYAKTTESGPRYELWPAPSFSKYLYPYIYIAKEGSLSQQSPKLPPFIANRGEVLLEMAMQKCAEFPGTDSDHLNIYHNLAQATYHGGKVKDMLIDLQRNDEEVGVSNIDFQNFPMYAAPWMTGQWQQTHAPYL